MIHTDGKPTIANAPRRRSVVTCEDCRTFGADCPRHGTAARLSSEAEEFLRGREEADDSYGMGC